jgi:hypothetical protein
VFSCIGGKFEQVWSYALPHHAFEKMIPMLECFFNHGADISARDAKDDTILHYAFPEWNNSEELKSALIRFGADPENCNQYGFKHSDRDNYPNVYPLCGGCNQLKTRDSFARHALGHKDAKCRRCNACIEAKEARRLEAEQAKAKAKPKAKAKRRERLKSNESSAGPVRASEPATPDKLLCEGCDQRKTRDSFAHSALGHRDAKYRRCNACIEAKKTRRHGK